MESARSSLLLLLQMNFMHVYLGTYIHSTVIYERKTFKSIGGITVAKILSNRKKHYRTKQLFNPRVPFSVCLLPLPPGSDFGVISMWIPCGRGEASSASMGYSWKYASLPSLAQWDPSRTSEPYICSDKVARFASPRVLGLFLHVSPWGPHSTSDLS